MKKALLVSLVGLILFSVGCSSQKTTTTDGTPTTPAPTETISTEVMSENLYKTKGRFDTTVTYVAEIKNTGTATVRIDDTKIDLEKTDGTILHSTDFVLIGPSVIAPGEIAYICQSILPLDNTEPIENIGKAIMHYTAKIEPSYEKPNVEITELSLNMNKNEGTIVGRIENKGDKELNFIYIVVPIRDENGTLKTATTISITSLKPGEKIGFSQHALTAQGKDNIKKFTYEAIVY